MLFSGIIWIKLKALFYVQGLRSGIFGGDNMASSKLVVFLINLYLQIILPLEMILKLFTRRYDTINEYVLLATYVLVIFFCLFSCCYWEYTNFYIRYVYCFFIIMGIFSIIYRVIYTHNFAFGELSNYTNQRETVIWIIVFIIIDVSIIFSKIKKKSCFTLAFPFKNGRFLVVDGGDGKQSFLLIIIIMGGKAKKYIVL